MKYKCEKCLFSIGLPILYYKKFVFKEKGKLVFSLLGCFCSMKNACSKQREAAFSLFSYFCNIKEWGAAF